MSRDTVLTDAEGKRYSYDCLSTQRWLDGHEQGALIVAKWIKDKAMAAFGRSNDKEAMMLRDLADQIINTLAPELKEKAAKHAERYPIELKDSDDS